MEHRAAYNIRGQHLGGRRRRIVIPAKFSDQNGRARGQARARRRVRGRKLRMSPGHPVYPPASAPSCIAVGGLDDQNSLDRARRGMYRSSYGPTFDGLQKPEVIAPGIWVPAPILPHTPTAAEAELYASLDHAPDEQLVPLIESHRHVDQGLYESRDLPVPLLRQLITIKLHEGSVISEHYKYVDGTSFAAPIVSSIVACMHEAHPGLTPQQVKRILIDTAERLPSIEIDRQGWGVVAPRRAVEVAIALRSEF
ncbi:MAG: S8 family serine peptidase [Pyrinomonadaceae bacterium]